MTEERRVEIRRFQDIDFNKCPRYEKHELSDDQILDIATKAATIGIKIAKNEAKIELFDEGFSMFKKFVISSGIIALMVSHYFDNITNWLYSHLK